MADYQRVIEFLRDVRQGAGSGGLQTVNDEVAHIAGEYAALCAAANERLRKCTGFLQQGLRTEAIHVAEETPNLLDLVAQLDLPDPQAWAEFCQNNGLAVPPALQMERAAQLNEAYAQDQPLEHLMARHRLLALARAPIRERLDVMRKIAALDANGGTWEKDLRIFEQARLKELPSAFYNAVKNHDTHAIHGLMEELNDQTWFEAPPADLLAAVTEAHARVQRSAVEAELRKLVEPLRDAYAARSVQECQALVQRWKNIMAAAGVTHVAGELMDEIRPVVAFIAEQTKRDELLKRFHEACKGFARMLDADAADAQLEAGYARLKEFKEEIPEDLTRRYMNKKTGRRKEADRSHKLRLAAIAGVFAVIVIVGIVVALLVSQASSADKWAQRINNAVAAHSAQGLEEARSVADQVKKDHPNLASEPKVAAALAALDAAQAKYAADGDSAAKAADKIEKARQAATLVMAKPGVTIDDIRSSAGALDASMMEANELLKEVAWADADGKLHAALAGAQVIRQTMQEHVMQAATGELKAITTALEAVPASPSTPAAVAEARDQIQKLAERAGKLASLPLLDLATRNDVATLRERIARRLQNADVTGGIAAALEKIRTAGPTVQDLRAALTDFNTAFPNEARAADFKRALDRLPAAESVEAWQAKMAAYQGNFAPANAADAQKRLDDVTAFLTAHPEFPRTAEAQQYAGYLKQAAATLADGGTWQSALDPLVSATAGNRLLTDMGYMQISDGRRFYTLGDPKRTEHRMMNEVSVTFQTIDLKPDKDGKVDYTKTVPVNIDAPLTVSQAPLPAPHAKMVSDIRDGLKTISGDNWDTFGIDLADRLARNDQMDLVVKAILLQQVLKTEVAVAGDLIGTSYDRTIESLARLKADDMPWPDPAKISDGTRALIKSIVDQMPAAAVVKQRLGDARTKLFKSLTLDALKEGVLLKDDSGAWAVYSHASPVDGTTLWAVAPAASPEGAGAGAANHLVQVGSVAAGHFVLDEAALKNLPQGTIVFLTRQ